MPCRVLTIYYRENHRKQTRTIQLNGHKRWRSLHGPVYMRACGGVNCPATAADYDAPASVRDGPAFDRLAASRTINTEPTRARSTHQNSRLTSPPFLREYFPNHHWFIFASCRRVTTEVLDGQLLLISINRCL